MKESISIPVNVIIRPRGGDFYYNENEVPSLGKSEWYMRIMLEDIEACTRIGVQYAVLFHFNIVAW